MARTIKITAKTSQELDQWIHTLQKNHVVYNKQGKTISLDPRDAEEFLNWSPPKKLDKWKIIGAVAVSLFLIGIFTQTPNDAAKNEPAAATTAEADTVGLNPEQKKMMEEIAAEKARQEKIQSLFSAWDGSLTTLKTLVKNNLHNPKSFEHVETRYADKGDHLIVVMQYRGENAFGAIRLASVTAKVDATTGTVLEILSE